MSRRAIPCHECGYKITAKESYYVGTTPKDKRRVARFCLDCVNCGTSRDDKDRLILPDSSDTTWYIAD